MSPRAAHCRRSGSGLFNKRALQLTLLIVVRANQPVLNGAPELDARSFHEFKTSKTNGMVKFFQPWCGHCIRMKQSWDQLAAAVHDVPVTIADVNCAQHKALCEEEGIVSYPHILVYKDDVESLYSGGRGLEELLDYVHEHLVPVCLLRELDHGKTDNGSACSDAVLRYYQKWNNRDVAAHQAEVRRLTTMSTEFLSTQQKAWRKQRLDILQQVLLRAQN